jgi:hypothetical protein
MEFSAFCDADAQPLHAAGERLVAVGLDDQVDVVALDGELNEAHPEPPAGCRERVAQATPGPAAAEVPDLVSHSQRDVDRHRLAEARPRFVRDQRTHALRLAPGAIATSTAVGETELELFRRPHDWGQIARFAVEAASVS